MADLRTTALMPPDEQTSVNLSPQMASDNPLLGLANNKLLLQYLSAAGQDIQAGRPLGANVNQVTQQNIAAQNYAKLLKKMLESGGKVSMDKDKVSINYPVNAADGAFNPLGSSGQAGTPGLASGDRGTTGENLAKLNAPSTNATLGGNLSAPNPSSSPLDIPASDLAGLTPQDISDALGFRMKAEELGQQKIADAMRYMVAQQKLNQPETQYPIPVPGVGAVTETQWKELPAETRAYAAYVYQSKKANPTEPVMSLTEFKKISPDTQIQYLKALQDDPSLMETALAVRRAGATNVTVGEKIGLKVEESKIIPRTAMNSGKLMEDIRRDESSEAFQNKLFRLQTTDPAAAKSFKVENRAARIQSIIDQGRGKQFDVKYDESTGIITFKVKWPNGDVEDYKYDLVN